MPGVLTGIRLRSISCAKLQIPVVRAAKDAPKAILERSLAISRIIRLLMHGSSSKNCKGLCNNVRGSEGFAAG